MRTFIKYIQDKFIWIYCVFTSIERSLGFVRPAKFLPYPKKFFRIAGVSKDLITVVIGGIVVTMPLSTWKLSSNFALGFLLGIPAFIAMDPLTIFPAIASIPIQEIYIQLDSNYGEIQRLVAQTHEFITQFFTYADNNNLTVLINSQGELNVRVATGTPAEEGLHHANRIYVLDRLIMNNRQFILDDMQRIIRLEARLAEGNIDHFSYLEFYRARFSTLSERYLGRF